MWFPALAIYQVPDVRPVLQRYSGKHIPTAWAEVEAEQKRAVLEEWEKTRSSVKGKIGSGFGGMFGVSNPQVRHESGPPKTQLEREREIYQRAYQDEQKYWVDNKSILENARKEDEEKQKEAMGKSVFAFVAAQMGLVRESSLPTFPWIDADTSRRSTARSECTSECTNAAGEVMSSQSIAQSHYIPIFDYALDIEALIRNSSETLRTDC